MRTIIITSATWDFDSQDVVTDLRRASADEDYTSMVTVFGQRVLFERVTQETQKILESLRALATEGEEFSVELFRGTKWKRLSWLGGLEEVSHPYFRPGCYTFATPVWVIKRLAPSGHLGAS